MKFDIHTLLFSNLAILIGCQAIFFALFVKVFAITEGLLSPDPRLDRFFVVATLEKSVLLATVAFGVGVMLLFVAINQ